MNWFNSPRPFLRAFEIAAVFLFGAYCGNAWASDETHAAMVRVERALVEAGFAAHGYSQLPQPSVEEVDELPGGRWGTYSVATGRITISRRQPDGCKRVTLAHEISHDLMVRMGILDTVPTREIMRELESAARIAEEAESAADWAPNCVMRGTK